MSQRPGQLTLEKELGDFLYKVLTGSVTQEYRNQLANWEIHTNSLIACARNASKHQKAWLDWAKKDHQSSVARLNALALLGLSLVTGPGLSFLSGYVQHRLVPRIFDNKYKRNVPNPQWTPPTAHPVPKPIHPVPKPAGKMPRAAEPIELKPSKVPSVVQSIHPRLKEVDRFDAGTQRQVGKFFGDLTTAFATNGKTIISIATPNGPLLSAVSRMEDSTDIDMLESTYKSVLIEAKKLGETTFQNAASGLLTPYNNQIDNFLAAYPDARDDQADRLPYPDQLRHYQKRLLEIVNTLRKGWATDWFYFGNSPPTFSTSYATNSIEAEMWAFWILSDNFKPGADDEEWPMFGDTGLKLEPIARRLRELGVIDKEYHAESWRRHFDKDLLPKQIDNIYGEVDRKDEEEAILKWAENHPRQYLGGNRMGYSPRTINQLDLTNIPI